MFEMLLKSPARPAPSFTIPAGVHFPGATEVGSTNSSGASKSGTTYNFTGGSQVDWVRLPGAGTIDIGKTPPNIEIGIDCLIRNFPSAYHTLWSRARQSGIPFGWQVICNNTGLLRFQNDSVGTWFTGSLKLNTRHRVMVRRTAGVWSFYLDEVLQGTLDFKTSQNVVHDWLFGSYLNTNNTPIAASGVASPVNWSLYGFVARETA